MKRAVVGFIAALGLVFMLIPAEIRNTLLSGNWSPVKSAHKYKGTYFRMKVSLVYKGELQNFDVVYGCNVNYVKYKDGSSTSEIGMVPAIYGRRMSDGKGLLVKAPEAACQPGNPRPFNPYMNENFMPLVAVFENADELGFGTAYISEDAYDYPGSELKFNSASISTAKREEFDEFRASGPPNLVRRETYHAENMNDQNAKALGIPVVRPMDELPGLGFYCEAYARLKVSNEISRILSAHWPNSKPKYWEPETADDGVKIQNEIKWPMMVARDDGNYFQDMRLFEVDGTMLQYGVRRRGANERFGDPNFKFVPPSLYPSYSQTAKHFLPRRRSDFEAYFAGKDSFSHPAIEMKNGAMKGKAFCFRGESLTGEQFGGPEFREPEGVRLRKLFYGIRRVATIDGEQVQLNPKYNDGLEGSFNFYEQDQYIWQIYQFGILSTRGDV
jgi:hypothetical protein